MSEPIRVVVADDSAFIRGLIVSYLQSTGGFEIVGTAEDGKQAAELVHQLRPDVVTLDVDMPVMSGLEALDQIMRQTPTPVVMVSGVSIRSAEITLKAIQAGAVDFVLKYVPGAKVNPEEIRLDVISKVRAAAGVRVVRTIPNHLGQSSPASQVTPTAAQLSANGDASKRVSGARTKSSKVVNGDSVRELIVVGASTGGPIAIKRFLGSLPANFAGAIVVVQHIPQPFTAVLAAQLTAQTPFTAEVVEDGDHLQARHIFIAPGDRHLLLNPGLRLELHDGEPIRGNRPSIDVTMKSIAQCFPYQVHGVLLTGMGDDGATGLAYIRSKGGTTYAQSGETCVVNGMPQRAIDIGAVDFVASPEGIAERLTQESMRHNVSSGSLVAANATGTHERDLIWRI
ncbi:MAG: chemotaxis-specific protein-glutamate methyltransferase CheB [Planctomycetales bacterium]|nr:chemotaxis-specific protein-glutamate methyltransferase CheB [Planctomycetales bacterium]